MFGKKKEPRVKEPSPREILINRIEEEIEKLASGQTLIYKLPEFYWSGFAAFLMVDLNPSYPEKGKKYLMSTDKIADGKPAGQKIRAWDSNKARDGADWIATRDGFKGSIERFQEQTS